MEAAYSILKDFRALLALGVGAVFVLAGLAVLAAPDDDEQVGNRNDLEDRPLAGLADVMHTAAADRHIRQHRRQSENVVRQLRILEDHAQRSGYHRGEQEEVPVLAAARAAGKVHILTEAGSRRGDEIHKNLLTFFGFKVCVI